MLINKGMKCFFMVKSNDFKHLNLIEIDTKKLQGLFYICALHTILDLFTLVFVIK